MVNVKLTLSYDGTDYHGFQEQENAVTVAGELTRAIRETTGENIKLICAGRTDSGVHAEGQVVNFLTSQERLKEYNWLKAINSKLPYDIRVSSCSFMPETFSSRFDATAREYWYHILNTAIPSALETRYTTHIYYPLDIKRLNEYCSKLVGIHDFTSFCSTMDGSECKIREIYSLSVEKCGEMVIMKIKGSSFLHNMVRVIVGTLLDLHRKSAPAETMTKILELKDRKYSGRTMPPNGLVFKKVYYDKFDN